MVLACVSVQYSLIVGVRHLGTASHKVLQLLHLIAFMV